MGSIIPRRNRFALTIVYRILIVIRHCQQFIILNIDNVFTGGFNYVIAEFFFYIYLVRSLCATSRLNHAKYTANIYIFLSGYNVHCKKSTTRTCMNYYFYILV